MNTTPPAPTPTQTSALVANSPAGRNCPQYSDLLSQPRPHPPQTSAYRANLPVGQNCPTCSDLLPHRPHPRRPPRPPQILPLVEIAPTAPTCWDALADLRTGGKSSRWSELPPMLRPARRTTPTHTKGIKKLVDAKIRRVFKRFVALLIDSININLSALYRLCLNFIIYSYFIYIIF